MLSCISIIRSRSRFLISFRMRVSMSVFVKFIILAAALTPPICDARNEVFAANLAFMTRSNSLIAPGSTLSMVAMRRTISGWISSGNKVKTSAANPNSKYEIINALIWGCSSMISSEMERASIQSKISICDSEDDGVIRPKTDCALSSPSAFVRTFSMYLPAPSPKPVCFLIVSRNSSRTAFTVS